MINEENIYDEDFFLDVEYTAVYGSSGIGYYEFWGSVEYDKGQTYVEEIHWDESKYTDYENVLIDEFVTNNYDRVSNWLMKGH